MSVQGPEDLLKFGRLRQEKKYEVALNRAYVLRVRVANFQSAPIVSWKLRDSDFDETWSAGRPGPNSS